MTSRMHVCQDEYTPGASVRKGLTRSEDMRVSSARVRRRKLEVCRLSLRGRRRITGGHRGMQILPVVGQSSTRFRKTCRST